jgi:uncharacterized protein (TIRG00374 family)
MGAKSRKWLLVGLGVVVVAFLLYHSRSLLRGFSLDRLLEAVRGANYSLLILATITIYACYALRALRWQKFQAHVGPTRFWDIYGMTLAGFSALFLLGRAGEPIRPILISRKENHPLPDTFGIYALERILDIASFAVLAAIGLLVFESTVHRADSVATTFEKAAKSAGTGFSLFALAAICGIVYLRLHGSAFLEKRLRVWKQAGGWKAKAAGILLGFVYGVQTIHTWSDAVYAFLLSAVHWALVVVVYYLVIHGFGGRLGSLTFTDAMLVLVFTMVGSAVQLPGVGGGAQALSIFALTKLFGVEQEPAVAAALVLWLITFVSCSLAGVPLLLKEGFSLGNLKSMSEQERVREQTQDI